jgi:predicted transcriptional regulator
MGVAMSFEDRREELIRLLNAKPRLRHIDIGKQLDVAPSTVGHWARQLIEEGYAQPRKRIGRFNAMTKDQLEKYNRILELRNQGFGWEEVAEREGVTRQAVWAFIANHREGMGAS